MRQFRLSEWLKDKSQKVVDNEGNDVTIAFCPMYMMENRELAGVWKAFKRGSKYGGVLCEEPNNLFFAD